MHKAIDFHKEKLNFTKKKKILISLAPWSISFLNYFHCLYVNVLKYIFLPQNWGHTCFLIGLSKQSLHVNNTLLWALTLAVYYQATYIFEPHSTYKR